MDYTVDDNCPVCNKTTLEANLLYLTIGWTYAEIVCTNCNYQVLRGYRSGAFPQDLFIRKKYNKISLRGFKNLEE